MTFDDAKIQCKVRGFIYRLDEPEKQYAKNHPIPLEERISIEDQCMDDWIHEDSEANETSIVG